MIRDSSIAVYPSVLKTMLEEAGFRSAYMLLKQLADADIISRDTDGKHITRIMRLANQRIRMIIFNRALLEKA